MALSTDFKDDVLASSNSKRKYNMIHNPDGTVSFEDVTVYSQEGSDFGAKEVNEEREEINKHTTLLGDTDISSIEDGTVTGAIAGLNGKLEWSNIIKIGASQGITLSYKYTDRLVEIIYEGTIVGGINYGAGTVGYTFPAMPSDFLPLHNFRHGIFSPLNNHALCLRIYPYSTSNWSISSESVDHKAVSEYVFGSFIYSRR